MRFILVGIIILLSSSMAICQDSIQYANQVISSKSEIRDSIFSNSEIPWNGPVTQETKFSGNLKNYISTHILLSEDKKIEAHQMRMIIHVKFIINSTGKPINAEIIKGGNQCLECDKAVIGLINNMSNWIPAENNGIKVSRLVLLPIHF